jgi:hypothetical protein
MYLLNGKLIRGCIDYATPIMPHPLCKNGVLVPVRGRIDYIEQEFMDASIEYNTNSWMH